MPYRSSNVFEVEIQTRTVPVWKDTLVTTHNVRVGQSFSVDLNDFVDGVPTPNIVRTSGMVGGLTFNNDTHILEGTFTTVQEIDMEFDAENSEGTTMTTIRFNVRGNLRTWLLDGKTWLLNNKIWGLRNDE